MRLLQDFITIALLGSNVVIAIQNIRVSTTFRNAGIVTDVIPVAPQDILQVYFGTNSVCLGNEIPHTDTIIMPRLEYDIKRGVNYTLLFIDPDLPAAAAPAFRSTIHWIVVNIPGDNVSGGHTIAAYMPVIFYPRSGYRRYVFLLYAQNRNLDVTDRDLLQLGIDRFEFSITDFASKYGLGELAAGNYFISSFDTSDRYCRA